MAETPGDPPSALAAQLEAVSAREAAFRASSVREFLELRKTIKLQNEEIAQLRLEATERQTYVHQLHLQHEADKAALHAAQSDLETFVQRLDRAEKSAEHFERARRSLSWKLAAPLRSAERTFLKPPSTPGPADAAPAGSFTYYLHTSPYRIFRDATFTLRGWVFSNDHRPIQAVRVRLGSQVHVSACEQAEPDVVQRHNLQGVQPAPGFALTFETPPGRHLLRLEAALEADRWQSFLTTPIWAIPRASR